LISKARRCLDNDDKECATKLIEDLIKNQCHNGYAVGKEVSNGVKDVVHELWLISDNELRCELLRMLRNFGISKGWVKVALSMSRKDWNKWLVKCGIDWEGRATRNNIVNDIEGLLRRLGWSEVRMCEELFKFIGIDVDEFRRYGVEPCIWLEGLEELSNLKHPYWLGMASSDLAIKKLGRAIGLELGTTNAVDAVFFPKILSTVKAPSLRIVWKRWVSTAKYVDKTAYLQYYIILGINNWSWLTKLDVNELKKMLNSFSDEELAEFIAGEIDGDGSIRYNKYSKAVYVDITACKNCPKRVMLDVLKEVIAERFGIRYNKYSKAVYVDITACKNCPKRVMLDVLKEVIAERFGIVGGDASFETADALEFGGEKAVRLLRRIIRYIHHPLRRLRAELILALHDGRISREVFEKLYEMTEYELGGPDVKRNHALEALVRAAPQTHTHGE